MLPVQVKVLSSSSCTLSEASALLQRFLSSDACLDFFAGDYVANVAQAVQNSISRRAGGLESRGKHNKHPLFCASSQSSSRFSKELGDVKQRIIAAGTPSPSPLSSKLHSNGKQSLLVAKNLASSVHWGAQTHAEQSLLVAENVGLVADGAMAEAENASKRRKKKRRHSAVDNDLESVPPFAHDTQDSALDHHDKKRRTREKHEREIEFVGAEDSTPDDKKHRDIKRRKDKQERETENIGTEYRALDDQKLHDKKKRRNSNQGRDTDNTETPHVTECTGSPTCLSVDGNLDMKSAVKGKEADNIDANKVSDARVFITPLSPKAEDHAGSSKRKRKEEKILFLASPDKVPFLEKSREETDLEVSPVEFESFASGEKKRKKTRRKKLSD